MTKFILCIGVFCQLLLLILSIDLSPCAKWDSKGETIVGTGIAGQSASQLNEPVGISIYDRTNQLYIADHRNARIQTISLTSSQKEATTFADNLYFPLHVYADDENDQPAIYTTLSVARRVEKWFEGAQTGIVIVDECNDCVGVAVDQNRDVYVTDTMGSAVIKWSSEANETSIVAGKRGESGSTAELLRIPQGIYIARTGKYLYVADSGNSRIQRFSANQSKGETVAGLSNGTSGNDISSLYDPISVIVDEKTNVVYVADTYNHRIMRWLPLATVGEMIAGFGGQGNNTNQLNEPSDLKFDRQGNLYVSDLQNHRIQMFRLLENPSCPTSGSEKLVVFFYPLLSIGLIFFQHAVLN